MTRSDRIRAIVESFLEAVIDGRKEATANGIGSLKALYAKWDITPVEGTMANLSDAQFDELEAAVRVALAKD